FSRRFFATCRRRSTHWGGSMIGPHCVSRRLPFAALLAFGGALAPTLRAQTLQDPDFVVEDLAGTYAQPTCFRFASATEFLVGEKGGVVWDVRDGSKRATPVIDPNQDGNDSEQESFGRLTRYTPALDANGNRVADPASRLVLIGATWSEGVPSLHLSHAVGDLRFASDGSLFLSAGDGAH